MQTRVFLFFFSKQNDKTYSWMKKKWKHGPADRDTVLRIGPIFFLQKKNQSEASVCDTKDGKRNTDRQIIQKEMSWRKLACRWHALETRIACWEKENDYRSIVLDQPHTQPCLCVSFNYLARYFTSEIDDKCALGSFSEMQDERHDRKTHFISLWWVKRVFSREHPFRRRYHR